MIFELVSMVSIGKVLLFVLPFQERFRQPRYTYK